MNDAALICALREEVARLAAPADLQLASLPTFVHRPDELALRFDDAWQPIRARLDASETQRAALEALDARLATLSGEANEAFWTEEAVRSDPRWEGLRDLARNVLRTFGWPSHLPPTDRGTYIV